MKSIRGRRKDDRSSSSSSSLLSTKLRHQQQQNVNILTRQTRHTNSPKSGINSSNDVIDLPLSTHTREDGTIAINWTPQAEIFLFKEMINHKLSGIKKHFNLIAISKVLSNRFGIKVTTQNVVEHMNTLFDTKKLEEQLEPLKVNVDEIVEFSLPKSFNSLISEKKNQSTSSSSSSSSSSSALTSGKTEKEGDVPKEPMSPKKRRQINNSPDISGNSSIIITSSNTGGGSNSCTANESSSSSSIKDKSKEIKSTDHSKSKEKDSSSLKGKGKSHLKFSKETRSNTPNTFVPNKKRRI